MRDFLLEIGTEEIPADYLAPAAKELSKELQARLEGQGFWTQVPNQPWEVFLYTPRRIAFFIRGLREKQSDSTRRVQGPSKKIAYDADGMPTKALIGFARSQNLPLDKLGVEETDNGPYVVGLKIIKGRTAMEVLAAALPEIILKLSFPKSMHWDKPDVTFARPIRSICAILGDEVVLFTVGSVKSDRFVHGHPFLAPDPIPIGHADLNEYKDKLRKAYVIVDFGERYDKAKDQIETLLSKHGAALAEFIF